MHLAHLIIPPSNHWALFVRSFWFSDLRLHHLPLHSIHSIARRRFLHCRVRHVPITDSVKSTNYYWGFIWFVYGSVVGVSLDSLVKLLVKFRSFFLLASLFKLQLKKKRYLYLVSKSECLRLESLPRISWTWWLQCLPWSLINSTRMDSSAKLFSGNCFHKLFQIA